MLSAQIISNLFRGIQSNSSHVLSLTPGQMILGEVKQILPDQLAIVRFGTMNVHAKLEAPLEVGQRTWFQVQDQSHPITLKVVPFNRSVNQTSENELAPLLSFLGLKKNDKSEQLLRFTLQHGMPMQKKPIQLMNQLLQRNMAPAEEILRSFQLATQRGLPLTQEVLQPLRSVLFSPPLIRQLEDVVSMFKGTDNEQLKAQITRYIESIVMKETPTADGIKNQLRIIGLENERSIKEHLSASISNGNDRVSHEKNVSYQGNEEILNREENMKATLQRALMDPALSSAMKERIEGVVQHISGQQLLFNLDQQPGPVSQLLFQLSIQITQQIESVSGQLEGRRNTKGQIDPENCRLLLFLQLQALGETLIDVQIVNKLISVSIYNESSQLRDDLKHIQSELTTALIPFGYTLTSLHWREPTQSKDGGKRGQSVPRHPLAPVHYRGVDIRV